MGAGDVVMAEKWNIFLDVDGVLNREQDWVRPWIKRRIIHSAFKCMSRQNNVV
jgi:histidinol phosphatase-like enzyme